MEKGKQRGHVYIRAGFAKDVGNKFKYYNALVDTGASVSVLPAKIAKELGVEKMKARRVMTGNGTITLYEAYAAIDVRGDKMPQKIWVSDTIDEVIIGVVVLEQAGLAVDPRNGRLRKARMLLYNIATT